MNQQQAADRAVEAAAAIADEERATRSGARRRDYATADRNAITVSKDGTFVTELSSQGWDGFPPRILVERRHTYGEPVVFERGHADYDASGEDIYGVHYRSASGFRMLVIND